MAEGKAVTSGHAYEPEVTNEFVEALQSSESVFAAQIKSFLWRPLIE